MCNKNFFNKATESSSSLPPSLAPPPSSIHHQHLVKTVFVTTRIQKNEETESLDLLLAMSRSWMIFPPRLLVFSTCNAMLMPCSDLPSPCPSRYPILAMIFDATVPLHREISHETTSIHFNICSYFATYKFSQQTELQNQKTERVSAT